MKTKKFYLPVFVIFRDREIDCESADRVIIPGIFLPKGRTLTLKNPSDRMEIILGKIPQYIKGDIRVKKKPIEMSPEELKAKVESLQTNNKSESHDTAQT